MYNGVQRERDSAIERERATMKERQRRREREHYDLREQKNICVVTATTRHGDDSKISAAWNGVDGYFYHL